MARVQDLDKIEDNWSLTTNESYERKSCQEAVADLKVEMDWQQLSRQLWLAAGDANTRFFHQAANGRRRANRIECLRMGDRVITGQATIGQALADHFRGFFRRGPPNSWRWTGARASCLSPDEQGSITGPFLVDEVGAAINGLNAEGAPGPDGIPVFFYRDCWDRVASDVMALMDEFHVGSARMDNKNRVYIALLSKVQGVEQVGDFRPISLSNNIYLIIAKVLANRLRRILQDHINPLQFAFIPGRQMMDSIVIAEEIIAEWKRSDTTGWRFLKRSDIWKVDFAKAYDSLNWRFLWNVFKRCGFPSVWIKWMNQCVHLHIRRFGQWLTAGEVDTSKTGDQAGMPVSPPSIHPRSRHLSDLHTSVLHAGISFGLSVSP